METTQLPHLLLMLQALADKNRLTMIGLMGKQERNVSEMAEILKLSDPTVSHHISKLHGAGLLHLRMAGNQRFYRVNEKGLAKFREYVAVIDTLPVAPPEEAAPDNAWIEALDWSDEDKKVLRGHTANRCLIEFPTKPKKWTAILRWVATYFEQDRHYTEKEVNAILTPINRDYATLRRYLVEFGFMRRERGGGDYWLTPDSE